MSNPKKVIRIKENDLVNLIDNIVTEVVNDTVQKKKKEWLEEQAKAGDKNAIFESKLNELTAKLEELTKNSTKEPVKEGK